MSNTFLSCAAQKIPKDLVLKTWKNTGLHDAWNPQTQVQAVQKCHTLFPNLDNLGSLDDDLFEDAASPGEIIPLSNELSGQGLDSHEPERQTDTEEWEELLNIADGLVTEIFN